MRHADLYVLCGTAFPILLLAFFASDTPLLAAPIFTGHQVIETSLTLGSALVGLAGCAWALATDTDDLALRIVVVAITMLVTARLVVLGVQHFQASTQTETVELARSMIEQLIEGRVGIGKCRVWSRGNAFYVQVGDPLEPDFKDEVKAFADQVHVTLHWS